MLSRLASTTVTLSLALTAPAHAKHIPQARLVHCGEETCLRLSGHREQPTATVRVAGRPLTVEGDRNWRVTVPLATAREWAGRSTQTLAVAVSDPQTGGETLREVRLPPGALGGRTQLASLEVHGP